MRLLSVVPPSRRLPRAPAFWSVAVLLVLMLAASGVPSPLYRVYQDEFGFGPGVLTTIFGIYAFALLASLLVVGGLSDHVGRRPVLIGAFLLEAVAMVLFLAADGVGWLLAARVVQGLATGALTSTLGASLLDLQRADRPMGAFINSASPGLGLSVGAVGAGLLVQSVASPDTWVFAVLAVVFVLAALGALLLPESSPRLPGAVASLRPRVHVPPANRRPFVAALPLLVACWALGGLYASLGPSLVADVFAIDNHLVGALLILALNGTGILGSLALRTAAPERAMLVGALVFTAGVLGTLGSLALTSAPLLFGSAVVTGFGFGAAFLGAVATITLGVAPGHRAGLLAAVFVVGYLAFSLPAIAAGIASGHAGLTGTTEVYGATVVVLALLAVTALVRARRAAGSLGPAATDAELRAPAQLPG
ncbi:MFS transporter [Blastococcus sp. TML/M2B]|uniref:MFS transporter n=1 Tax=unclassified Blastococcus TaxID=2619396 RepID=UPI00190DF3F5|nr:MULTISPECIES: MFS transporter [unclassified Blastococcus]MBN1091389.1 MFS transporter [Blastococcus sp. TML/M2B]MBN1095054.1 MFS transporter [Blastococcus sp. TML/C7B]